MTTEHQSGEGRPCLHCAIRNTIIGYYRRNGELTDKQEPIVPIDDVCVAVGEVTAQFVSMSPDRAKRRRWQKFAHDCIDAGMRSIATGKRQSVEYIPPAEPLQ